MSEEPFYVCQSGDPMTEAEARAWYAERAADAHAEGATFCRLSYHPDIPNLRIVEGWRERPVDQGEIRWAPIYADPASSR